MMVSETVRPSEKAGDRHADVQLAGAPRSGLFHTLVSNNQARWALMMAAFRAFIAVMVQCKLPVVAMIVNDVVTVLTVLRNAAAASPSPAADQPGQWWRPLWVRLSTGDHLSHSAISAYQRTAIAALLAAVVNTCNIALVSNAPAMFMSIVAAAFADWSALATAAAASSGAEQTAATSAVADLTFGNIEGGMNTGANMC